MAARITARDRSLITFARENPVVYQLVTGIAPAPKKKTRPYATKAERAAGGGFTCTCGRTGLRYEPRKGSFHNTARDGSGNTHTL